MAEQGTVVEDKSSEDAVPTEEGGEKKPDTPTVTEEGASTEDASTEQQKEKKFTDEDMKKVREKYQKETREERDARIKAETKAELLEQLHAGKKPEERKEETVLQKPVRPREADFTTREEYEVAMDKYEDDRDNYREAERVKLSAAREAETKRTTERSTFQQKIVEQVTEGRKLYKDFDDVVVNNPDMVATPMMAAAFLRRDNGHDIQYFIGKNPEEGKRLASISDPMDLAAEVGILSAKLKADKSSTEKTTQQAKQVTKAPAPAATVASKAKVSTDTSLEGKTQEERMRLLEQRSLENRKSGRWQMM